MRLRFIKQIGASLIGLNAVTDEIAPAEMEHVQELTYYIVFGAGTSAGGVQPESAHIPGYAGSWAAEGSAIAWAAANKVHKVMIAGASVVSRCRISTAIVGGSVDIYAIGRG